MPGLNYFADDREEAMLPVTTVTCSDGASNEKIVDHNPTIAIELWIVSIVISRIPKKF